MPHYLEPAVGGADVADGVIAFLDGPPMEDLPGGAAFMEAYDAAGFAEPPEAYGAFAYVAGTIITNAINEVGPDRAAVAEYINTTDMPDTIIGPVKFNEFGQNDIPLATAFVVQDGLAKWRYVQVGLENDQFAEILPSEREGEGVKAGETVIVDGHFTLAHDAKVTVEK